MASDRFFEHRYTDAPFRLSEDACLRSAVRIAERLIRLATDGPFVYTGGAGIVYALLRLVTSEAVPFPMVGDGEVQRRDVWTRMLEGVRDAVNAVRNRSERHHGWSTFCGHAGVYVVAALVFDEAAKTQGMHTDLPSYLQQERQRALRRFDSLAVLASTFSEESVGYPEDEVLYGRSGYLLGVLSLAHLGNMPYAAVRSVVKSLIDSGKFQSERLRHPCPLYYEWPRGDRSRPYLGAAHGLMGILYVLLHFRGIVEELGENQTLLQSVHFVLQMELPDATGVQGYYPTAMESGRAPLVQWCHGSCGAVYLFCKAYEIFRHEPYLEAAVRAGEVIWQKGLLKKGPGLCHGVSGNGYALIKLYQSTLDEKYLSRAHRFAEFMLSDHFNAAQIPDHPWSLYEGWAGALCFLLDLLNPLGAAFPVFDL